MKPKKVWAALELYDRELGAIGVETQQFDAADYGTAALSYDMRREGAGLPRHPDKRVRVAAVAVSAYAKAPFRFW